MKEKIQEVLKKKINNLLEKDDITYEEYKILHHKLEEIERIELEEERKKELFDVFFKSI